MRVGIAYDLKTDPPVLLGPGEAGGLASDRAGLPDDFQEEFDSPVTIEAVASVLRDLGHDVDLLGDGRGLIERLLDDAPDFVFNIAEGQGVGRSREARVPGVLEMLGIPYSGSDPLTLAVTLDKDCAKRLVQSAGVPVPRGVTVRHGDRDFADLPAALGPLPVLCKPAWEGSSKGIRQRCLVECWDNLPGVIASLQSDHRQPVLVEEFVAGDELTVGVVGNEAPEVIGVMRVLPRQPTDRFVYSLEVKRDYQRQVFYECPARLPQALYQAVTEAALRAYQALGCRDVARVDFRLRDGVPYFLEVNPLPGLNPESSDLVILARLCGWGYARLIGTIFQSATDRHFR